MTRRHRKIATPPDRTACNLAALAALGLLAVASAPVLAATAGATLDKGAIPVIRGVVSQKASGGFTFNVGTSATLDASAIKVNGVATGDQVLTITQLVSKLVLDWDSFDLANGSVVNFVQPTSTSAVLNRIHDLNPSTIEGKITANGQVYLVNQNGILFNRGTQIDVGALFASTLNVTDKAWQTGITSGATDNGAGGLTGSYAAFAGGYDGVASPTGAIVIGGGSAAAAVPRISAASGGSVVIVAPLIDNRSGIITSPDGQVILAAGNSVYLGFGSSNPAMRGMLVEVTAPSDQDVNVSSYIRNAGTIGADRGNVTLAGLAINQEGRISATSAMLTNGSIYLQARTLNKAQYGSVTLAAGSVTETPLDTADATTMHEGDDWTPYRPVVNVEGAHIDVEGTITSPSGKVSFTAADPSDAANARIYLGAGSLVDASGAWSTASDASNLLTFKVTSNELADSPDQKGGLLLGATVTVDLRESSTLLDLSGYKANQARTLAQKAAQGGIVSFGTSGDLIERSGATVNVSGGGVHYTGATESTTKLLGVDGKLYDIMSAPEQLAYTRIADTYVASQARWGYSKTYSNLLMGASTKRADYTEGAAGGSLSINMTSDALNGLVLDGRNLAGVTVGSQQLDAAPRGGTLTLGFADADKSTQNFGIGDVTFLAGAVTSLAAGFGIDSSLSDDRRNQLLLSADVFSGFTAGTGNTSSSTGFSTVVINANGRVTVPEDVTLTGPVGGSLVVNANQIEVDGHISAPAGSVTLTNLATAGTTASPVGSSAIVVAQGAGIDARGTWTNNYLTGQVASTPTAVLDAGGTARSAINGGTITLDGADVQLAAGSVLDVSAGGVVSTKGALSGGDGGAISLTLSSSGIVTDGALVLGGTLRGEGFANGGSLSLATTGSVQIGGTAAATVGLALAADRFASGGFGAYSVSAGGDLTLASDTILAPQQQNLQFYGTLGQSLASGGDVLTVAQLQTLPDDTRHATSLGLASTSGALKVQAGAGIGTDAGAVVSLAGQDGVSIAGTIYAPGGTINVSVAGAGDTTTPALELASTGFLSTRGAFVQKTDDKGLVQGTLWDAGSVNLSASKATIALDAGSIIDVSGTTQVVDQATAIGSSQPYAKVTRYSSAGTLSIAGNDDITLGGALRANASGSAAGGSFALTFTERGDQQDPSSGRRIVVSQSGGGEVAATTDKDLAISATKLSGSGFDKLRLSAEDQIVFADSATLSFDRGVTLDSKVIQVADGANALVTGASVKLADPFGTRVRNNPDIPSDLSTTMDSSQATPAQATLAGTGTLTVKAGTIDVAGSVTLSGVTSTTLSATNDLRLSGRVIGAAGSANGATLQGSLTTAGDLTLKAAQVYPTTGSQFSIALADGLTGVLASDATLSIQGSGATRGDVYSAGGSLVLTADHIEQAGVVKAPLGSITIKAGQDLTLAAGSITSVSADGLTTLYGETQSGVTWTYGATGSDAQYTALTGLPAKQITLDAPTVDVKGGATVDISGGGDVAAVEFVPGSGGNTNVLTQANTYAILPAANLSAAPIDADLALTNPTGLGKDSSVYNTIHIGSGAAVPAGDYVLLPGYYALLKGAYVVQLLTGSAYANMQGGQVARLANGQAVVAGRLEAYGTDVVASNTVGVVLRPGSDVAKLGDYTVTTSSYFATLASRNNSATPLLPTDGGRLAIAATQRLTLDGDLVANLPTSASRSAEVDITADKIALVDVVGRTDIASDYLQIDSGSLSRLDASLLIGGLRSNDAGGLVLTPAASDIVIANSASDPLKAPEVILAATDSITVRSGSVVEGSGARASVAQDFSVGGSTASGAIVRVANSGLAQIARSGTDSTRGSVTVEAGATLAASGSLTLDATGTTVSNGTLSVGAGGGLSLVSGSLSLGETDALAGLQSGLVLSNDQLAAFSGLGTLSLKSYGGISLYGDAQVGAAGLKTLVIDGAWIAGRASASGDVANAHLAAAQVTLQNTSTAAAVAVPVDVGAGALAVDAGTITLGAGDKTVSGFTDVQLRSTGEILASGTGSLTAVGTLSLFAARIASTSGADQAWSARDGIGPEAGYLPVSIAAVTPAAALAESGALGSRLEIAGSRIDDGGTITMKAGAVTLQALGADAGDGVRLNAGAVIDAGGAARDFVGTTAVADAGKVTLAAEHGGVAIAQGATVDVSAAAAGGDAGTVSVQAQSLDLQGRLSGASAKGTQGSFALDVAAGLDFSTLNAQLNAGSFTASRDIRVRSGDLVVAASDVVTAHHLVLESDQGSVTVRGRLDASAAQGGGSVAVYGASVDVAASAVIVASGTSAVATSGTAAADGGSVALVAASGTLNFADGAVIDVRSGATGDAGSVLLRAPRTGDSLQASLSGQVLSQRRTDSAAAEIDIEGNRVYGPGVTGDTITAAMIAGYGADNQAWMNAVDAASLVGGLRGDAGAATNVHVRPAVEVQAAGDLTIASTWDLTGTGWSLPSASGTGHEAGSLVVRAAGDLTLLSASLGNPDANLVSVPTWNIALTSGAELGAANGARNQSARQLAAQAAAGTAGAGDLVLDSRDAEASVRTGTGEIRLSAGRDFAIRAGIDADSGAAVVGAVYTTGRAAIADPDLPDVEARFAQGGGDVTVTAQRDAVGAASEWLTDWYRSATDAVSDSLQHGAWWAWRGTFHDGVATLGGGDVSIRAGRNVVDLSAYAPTSAIKVGSGSAAVLRTWGGGDVSVLAGNDLLGGQYLVSLGQGTLRAGGDIGSATQAPSLYLMGASDTASARAGLKLVAGQSATVADLDNPANLYLTLYPDLNSDDTSFIYSSRFPVLSYAADSGATIAALAGDVRLGNHPAAYDTLEADQAAATRRSSVAFYPAALALTAFGGDIVYTGDSLGAVMFPSTSSNLKLLAAGSINDLHIVVSDADASVFAIGNVVDDGSSSTSLLQKLGGVGSTSRLTSNTSTDPFVYDVVALAGDVTNPVFSFTQRSRVWAGGSVVNAQLDLQNTAASDVTEVVANTGSLSRSPVPDAGNGIRGPGTLLLQAGKDIDMGTQPLVSDGNQRNASLTDATGATVTLLAGVTGVVDVTQLDKFFDALQKAGTNGDKEAAQKAVDGLFDTGKGIRIGQGSIDSYSTSVQSSAGGGINLLAPGGDITVGLTTPSTDTIGLLTTAGGAIRSYLSGDFDINKGKVITAQGGDILIYTRDGSIDAGKGAHTSSTTPPPTRVANYVDGVFAGYTYKLAVAVSGSGIQTVTSKPSGPTSVAPKAGDIYLYAPSGTIDAGEAGIASGGNIFVIALTVLNADNISAAGSSTGVPQVAVGSLASSLASSGATTATGTAPGADAAAAAAAAASNGPNFKPAILTVEVLGFGEKNCKESDKDCFAK